MLDDGREYSCFAGCCVIVDPPPDDLSPSMRVFTPARYEGDEVDSGMVEESFIFGGYEGIDHVRRHSLVVGVYAVSRA